MLSFDFDHVCGRLHYFTRTCITDSFVSMLSSPYESKHKRNIPPCYYSNWHQNWPECEVDERCKPLEVEEGARDKYDDDARTDEHTLFL